MSNWVVAYHTETETSVALGTSRSLTCTLARSSPWSIGICPGSCSTFCATFSGISFFCRRAAPTLWALLKKITQIEFDLGRQDLAKPPVLLLVTSDKRKRSCDYVAHAPYCTCVWSIVPDWRTSDLSSYLGRTRWHFLETLRLTARDLRQRRLRRHC